MGIVAMPMQHKPDLKQLAQMLAVVERGSIAAAARALGMAQPALSRRLRDLETLVGCALFQRDAGGARPTPAGYELAERARALIAARDELIDDARRRAAGEIGKLAIGFNETVSWSGVVPQAIRRFRAVHPNVRLVALPMSSAAARLALSEGRIALSFMFGRPNAEASLVGIEVSTESLMLAVHRDDPLAFLPEPVPLTALIGSPMIWFDRPVSPHYYDQVLGALAAAGMTEEPVQVTTNTSAMLALVNAGAGYSFVPAAAAMRKPADVVLKRLDRADLDQRFELVWRADGTDQLIRRFVECTRSIIDGSTDATAAQ